MEWHLLVIYEMYVRRLTALQNEIEIDEHSIKEMLKKIDAWTSSAQYEKTPLGVAIQLIFLIEQGLQANIWVDPFILEKMTIGAYIVAWKITDDLAIHTIDFIKNQPSPPYSLDFLGKAEKDLLKTLHFNSTSPSIEAVVCLIKQYCSPTTFSLLIVEFWLSPLQESVKYAIEMLNQKSDGISISIYIELLKKAPSISHIKILLAHLEQHASDDMKIIRKYYDKIIIAAQERCLVLAAQHPAAKLDFLTILHLSAPNKEMRLEKLELLVKAGHQQYPDWHIRHIISTLRWKTSQPPSQERDTPLIDLQGDLRSIKLTPEEKKLTVILFDNYCRKLPPNADVTDAYKHTLACVLAAIRMVKGNNDANAIRLIAINGLFNIATGLSRDHYVNSNSKDRKLSKECFISYCYESFKRHATLTTDVIADITEAVKTHGFPLALKILACAANLNQLKQLETCFDTFDWQTTLSTSMLFQPIPVKEQLTKMHVVMHEILESKQEKSLDEAPVASPSNAI